MNSREIPVPILIIGGGLAGVTVLHKLVENGYKAKLLEARGGVALETSFANGGMLTASMSDPWNGPGVWKHLLTSIFDPDAAMKLRLRTIPSMMFWGLNFLRNSTAFRHQRATISSFLLARHSTQLTDALRHEHRLEYGSSERGTMKVFETEAALNASLSVTRILESYGMKFSILNADEAVQVEPMLSGVRQRIHSALLYPDDRSGDAHRFVTSLASKALDKGAEILTNVSVDSILVDNGNVTGVMTDRGPIDAETIVLAAGNGAAKLARTAGVSLSIKPVKGYSLSFARNSFPHMPTLPVIDDAMHAAVVPLGDTLRAVGTAEWAGEDRTIDRQRIDNLFSLVQRLYPLQTDRLTVEEGTAWAGLRPMSSDGLPFIGGTRIKGLWVNAGHGHLGWTTAVGSADILVDTMMQKKPVIDHTPYQVDRL